MTKTTITFDDEVWVVVPKTATAEIEKAITDVLANWLVVPLKAQLSDEDFYLRTARNVYRAAISASPQPGTATEPSPWDEIGKDKALSRWILQDHELGGLHPDTAKLVRTFAFALADKLRSAERKYGYSNGWKTEDWEAECQRQLALHVQKGDPCDVAAYAAFCWARKWSTAGAATEPQPIPMVLFCPKCSHQHIDAPEEPVQFDNGMGVRGERWTNPPHRSHLCARCGHIWRPADVATTGVEAIKTSGSNDSPLAQAATEPTGRLDGWRLIETFATMAHGERAIVAGRYKNGVWYVEEGLYRHHWIHGWGWEGRFIEPPTHWQPLPEPPND